MISENGLLSFLRTGFGHHFLVLVVVVHLRYAFGILKLPAGIPNQNSMDYLHILLTMLSHKVTDLLDIKNWYRKWTFRRGHPMELNEMVDLSLKLKMLTCSGDCYLFFHRIKSDFETILSLFSICQNMSKLTATFSNMWHKLLFIHVCVYVCEPVSVCYMHL